MLFGETNGRGKRCAQNLSNRFKSYNSCKYIIGCHRNLRYVHTSYALFCLSGNQKSPKRLIVSEIFQIFAGESEWEEPRGLLIQKHAVPACSEKNICRAQKNLRFHYLVWIFFVTLPLDEGCSGSRRPRHCG